MVARRKKLKEQVAAGDGSGKEKLGQEGRLKVKKKKEKRKQQEAEKLEEEAAARELEDRRAAKRFKREERRRRKEAEAVEREEKGEALAEEEGTKMSKEKRKRKEEENAIDAVEEEDGTRPVGRKSKNAKKKKVDRWGAPVAPDAPPQPEIEENENDDHQREETGEEEYHPKKIYAGGMPYTTSEDEIHSYFSECGAIEEIDYTTFPDTGRFRGLAFITFKVDSLFLFRSKLSSMECLSQTQAAVKKALELDGADMGGRFLRIMRCKIKPQDEAKQQKTSYAEPPPKTEGCTSVYVGNLSWDATEKDLRQFFKRCKITSVRLALDKETREFKGFGHVDFEDDESVERAIKLDQKLFLNRPIKIAYAVPPKKPTSSTNSDREPRKDKSKKNGCFSCGEEGHRSFQCPKKAQD
ncbi:RNA-binding protein CP33, chloroplastic isoform X1 [Selaginella moellendorffii]|uniref:RNA-binding protein CP33, chloroplastic isoform X1 n=1 Tax=Selaginella moellendorffii TaxID=88036 RepID=UPI000D1C830A|nr:RNA-binding protein CP33, chloroplastic isoform X1 [Selaginella moellendorffii]|eukprot:XP_024520166.1 RNA-binding protein CP33, chloroplastic isoform X1 [Selaginella moellendorffii]